MNFSAKPKSWVLTNQLIPVRHPHLVCFTDTNNKASRRSGSPITSSVGNDEKIMITYKYLHIEFREI